MLYELDPGAHVLVEIEGRHLLAKVTGEWCNGYRLARLQDALPYPSTYWQGTVVSITAPFAFAPSGHLVTRPVARFV